MSSLPPISTELTSFAHLLREQCKTFRRWLRYKLLVYLIGIIERQPIDSIPRLRRLFKKIFVLVFSAQLRRASELLPEEFATRKTEILRGMIDNQVMNLLEVFFYEKILAVRPNFIKIEGIDHLERAFLNGRGVIILTAHFGNWELLGYTLVKLGVPLYVIARPQALNQMTDLMNSFRSRRGVKVLMANNLSESLRLLGQGKAIAILADLDAKERGYQVPFFGRPASFYPTPVILSVRTKAPLLPIFLERQPDDSHFLRIEPPIEWQPKETMAVRIRKYVERYEAAIRRRPDLWVWFHERYAMAHLARIEE